MQLEQLIPKKPALSTSEEGIVLPALLWWFGVPLTLIILLYLIGVF